MPGSFRPHLLIAAFFLLITSACAPTSNAGLSPTSTAEVSPVAPPASLPSTDTPLSTEESFPLITPNPLTVHAILDTDQAISNADQVYPGSWRIYPFVEGKTADGIEFSLIVNTLLSPDTDGNLIPAYGTVVTITPISSIEGIPFSQGYLAAFHISPDGLLMITPGMFNI